MNEAEGKTEIAEIVRKQVAGLKEGAVKEVLSKDEEIEAIAGAVAERITMIRSLDATAPVSAERLVAKMVKDRRIDVFHGFTYGRYMALMKRIGRDEDALSFRLFKGGDWSVPKKFITGEEKGLFETNIRVAVTRGRDRYEGVIIGITTQCMLTIKRDDGITRSYSPLAVEKI